MCILRDDPKKLRIPGNGKESGWQCAQSGGSTAHVRQAGGDEIMQPKEEQRKTVSEEWRSGRTKGTGWSREHGEKVRTEKRYCE
jgi:hypothetical protein